VEQLAIITHTWVYKAPLTLAADVKVTVTEFGSPDHLSAAFHLSPDRWQVAGGGGVVEGGGKGGNVWFRWRQRNV